MNKQLLDKISHLNQATVEALREADERKIMGIFCDSAISLMGADFGFVWMNRNSLIPSNFQLVYINPHTPFEPKRPRNNGTSNKVIKTKKPLFVEDMTKSRYIRNDARPFVRGIAVIPMVYRDRVYGSFYVCFRKRHTFKEEERQLAGFICNDAGQVITLHELQDKTRKESAKLLKQKDEFFNIASHELKTPVTTIKGFAQMLNERLRKNKDSRAQYLLEKIDHHADKLSRLINDLLDVTRIDTGKLKFEQSKFELKKLLEDTLEGLRIAFPSNNIHFTYDHLFWIMGDSERMGGVITNLITNAAKYSPAGSDINVSLTREGDVACLMVEDFGYGIPSEDRTKVFNRFFQSQASNKKNLPGLGLGLYIANSIVKHHDGELFFRSKRAGAGTIFYLKLPYYRYKKVRKRT